MDDTDQRPSRDDLARHGNLQVSCWAPPEAKALADVTFRSLVSRLLDAAQDLLVLGYRPGRLAGLPADVTGPHLPDLLSRLAPSTHGPAFARLDRATARAHFDLLLPGAFPLRHRFLDEHGQTRIRFLSAGTLLLGAAPDAFLDALTAVAPAPAVSVTLGVVVNPYAGFGQREAHELRRHVANTPARLTVLWSGANRAVCVHGDPGLLEDVCARTAGWLQRSPPGSRPGRPAGTLPPA